MRIAAFAMALTLAGCATAPTQHAYPRDLGGLVYQGVDRVLDTAAGLSPGKPIIVATTVDVDDLEASSTFGRLASQLISSRLSQRGYMVRDVTYTGAVTVTPETGEMVLSREAAKLAAESDAQAVVAGAYAVGGEKIYLNIRLLRAVDGRVMSAADIVVPLDVDTHRLVVTGRHGAERGLRASLGR
ncbi:MAG TPA: FlgO family outer membrane protein [Caulobacteraceae bacterium]